MSAVMPDELTPDPLHYRKRSHEELVQTIYQLLDEQKVWRQRWKEEQQKRLRLQEVLP